MARILIIDDAEPTRQAIRTMLEIAGHEVQEASGSDEGFSLYKTEKPDLVFMDLLMPDKNGLDAIKEFKAADPNVKIIAVSASGLDYLAWAKEYGAIDSLAKPFERAQLEQTVNKALGT